MNDPDPANEVLLTLVKRQTETIQTQRARINALLNELSIAEKTLENVTKAIQWNS